MSFLCNFINHGFEQVFIAEILPWLDPVDVLCLIRTCEALLSHRTTFVDRHPEQRRLKGLRHVAIPLTRIDFINIYYTSLSAEEKSLSDRAKKIARLIADGRGCKTDYQRRRVRKGIRETVTRLYPDLCVKHRNWIRDSAFKVMRPKPSSDYPSFYECAQKWLRKSGCPHCPLLKID